MQIQLKLMSLAGKFSLEHYLISSVKLTKENRFVMMMNSYDDMMKKVF